MKTSRISAAIVVTLAMFAAASAGADPGVVTGGGTAVLQPFTKAWVIGDKLGPARIGQKTGAGTMDAAFSWDKVAYETDKTTLTIGTLLTRSNNTPNNNNSYEQGGFALAKLSASAPPVLGPLLEAPNLNGDRPFMRPQIGFTSKYVVTIAASEDNASNNGNPKPVLFLFDKAAALANTTGGPVTPVKIPNSNRNNVNKPVDLINLAVSQGIRVPNQNNQRGPHSIVEVPGKPGTFIVGMQYNNQAQEAFSVTIADDATVTMNWVTRYSNNARHCRPQVAITPDGKGYITAVEANNQPAEIGFRLTQFDTATGKAALSKIVVRSQPNQRLYVAEPSIGVVGNNLAIEYSMTSTNGKNGQNGHGNVGAQLSNVAIFNATDLTMVGTALPNASAFSRHAHLFGTVYGPDATPAVATIAGSSDGQKGAFIQYLPLTATGTLGVKDYGKMYNAAMYSDVANVQARGKRNPNDQAKGFINGLGIVPNPGFTADPVAAQKNFMPETKCFSISAITGYTDPAGALLGIKNSVWLSLTPAAWQNGLPTTPGNPTPTPGTNADGTGPAPRTTGPGTNPDPNSSSEGSVIPGGDHENADGNGSRASLGQDNGGCSVSHGGSSSGAGVIALAIAGVLAALRRKREEA
jgi:MYXO-CTERM domain-containing protein